MKIHGIGRLRQAVRRLKNRFKPGVLILLYHRVVELPSDPYLMSETSQNFAEHLEVLQQHGCLMSLKQLVGILNKSMTPANVISSFAHFIKCCTLCLESISRTSWTNCWFGLVWS